MPKFDNNSLECVEINTTDTPKYSVIWLHGLGADGHDFVPLVQALPLSAELQVRFIFPHAPIIPITINNGHEMRAWFDIYGTTLQDKVDVAGILNATRQVEALITKEEMRGVQSRHILLAGFSQGAVVALTTGLRCQKPLAGILALSGFLPLAETTLAAANALNRQLPIFIAHGTEDTVVPYALGKATYVTLKQANYPITWHCYPIGHSVCPDEILDMGQWMQSVLSAARVLSD